MTYAQLLSETLDTVKGELQFRSLKGHNDETLEQAYILLRHHCEEHACFQRWWDFLRAPDPMLGKMLQEKAVSCTMKVMAHAAEIASEHG